MQHFKSKKVLGEDSKYEKENGDRDSKRSNDLREKAEEDLTSKALVLEPHVIIPNQSKSIISKNANFTTVANRIQNYRNTFLPLRNNLQQN